MSEYLPFEIQTEIIKRITDVKSVIRCKSLSKSFKALIESSEFNSSYRAHHNQEGLLLFYPARNDINFSSLSLVDDVNVTNHVKEFRMCRLIGSSSGLVCLCGHNFKSLEETLVIWNPLICKSVSIAGLPCAMCKTDIIRYGFGICPETNDPTIVGIFWDDEIWSFKLSSKTWEMLTTTNFPHDSISLSPSDEFSPSPSVAIHGWIFWLAEDKTLDKFLIFAFDLDSHECKVVHLPSCMDKSPLAQDRSLCKLNESLVVCASMYAQDGLLHQLWKMVENDGAMTSFEKIFTFHVPGPSPPLVVPIFMTLGFTPSGEPIFEIQKIVHKYTPSSRVGVYKECSGETIDLGIEAQSCSIFVCSYPKTLLLVDYPDFATDPNTLTTEERLNVTLKRDGGIIHFDLQGTLSLQVPNEADGYIQIQIEKGDNSKIQFSTHPDISEVIFTQKSILTPKALCRPLQARDGLVLLKWRLESTDDLDVPLTIKCLPVVSGNETHVTIKYDASSMLDLKNVVISVPLPALIEAPTVARQIDGQWRYDSKNSVLEWSLLIINDLNRTGLMEFVVPAAADTSAFFPISVRFSAASTFSNMKVVGILPLRKGKDVPKFVQKTQLVAESYQGVV